MFSISYLLACLINIKNTVFLSLLLKSNNKSLIFLFLLIFDDLSNKKIYLFAIYVPAIINHFKVD
jgi:hypothetical protein